MPLESNIERAVKRWCESQGWKYIKLTGYTGIPDRMILTTSGLTVFLELKRSEGRQSRAQLQWQKWLLDHNHEYLVAWSTEEAKAKLTYVHQQQLTRLSE